MIIIIYSNRVTIASEKIHARTTADDSVRDCRPKNSHMNMKIAERIILNQGNTSRSKDAKRITNQASLTEFLSRGTKLVISDEI